MPPELTILQRMAGVARRRYGRVCAIFAVLCLASIALMTRLHFDTDMLRLLPQSDPPIAAYVEALERFGTGSVLVVAVRIPEGAVVEPYEGFADLLAAEVARGEAIAGVEHKLGDPDELLRTVFPKAVLFLDAAGRAQLAERLGDEQIAARTAELRRRLGTPQGAAMKELLKLDPLGLGELFLDRMQSSRGAVTVDWTSGYYLSRDHRLLVLLARPTRPPQDVKFCKQLLSDVRARIEVAKQAWPALAGPGGPSVPEVVLGGPYLTTAGDGALIARDMALNVVTSALGVMLLFLVAFRRPGALLYAFVPLVGGLLLSFGFAKIALGSLSSVTSVTAALLIGLGIDFVIVNYGRFIEERRRGATLDAALLAMNGSSGRAVVTGAVTTAATFFAFSFTEFSGLRQMGLLTGMGILFCLVSILYLLPALLAWREDRHARRSTEPNLYIHTFGTERLMRACIAHPRSAIGVGLAITALAALAAASVTFDESMKTMRPQQQPGADVNEEVSRRFGAGFDSMTLLLRGRTVEEVLALSERAGRMAERLVAEGALTGSSGVTTLIPPLDRQRETLAWLERERSSALDLARIRKTFRASAVAAGLRPEPFEPGLALLGEAIGIDGPIGADSFAESEQAQLLLDRYLSRGSDGWLSAVYLYPPANRWRREAPPRVVEAVRELGGQATLTGTNVINERVRAIVLRDAWIAGLLGYVLVGLLLWLDFRSLRLTILALVPLSIGIVWMVGAMAVFGIQMNFINIFVTTMIIGIGVDYGVHVIHRYRELAGEPWADRERGLLETGGALVIAALSTIVGFGSIAFSHYPGLRTVGMVAILGALSTCSIAITLLPAYLSWRDRPRA